MAHVDVSTHDDEDHQNSDLRCVLQSIHLETTLQRFCDQKIDLKMVPSLTDDELAAVGVETIGDRIRLRHAVNMSRSQTELDPSSDSSTSLAEQIQRQRTRLFGASCRKRPSTSVKVRRTGSGKQTKRTWTATVVCLSDKATMKIPTAADKATLYKAGLGNRRIQFDVQDDEEAVMEVLMSETSGFPQLRNCGGFELLRSRQNCRDLELIDCTWSVDQLKAHVGGQCKIYLRPIQSSLSTLPITPEVIHRRKELCKVCFREFKLRDLRSHRKVCKMSSDSDSEMEIASVGTVSASYTDNSFNRPSTSEIASGGRSAHPEGSSTVSASYTDNSFNNPSTGELVASEGRSAQPEGSSTVSASNTDNSFNHPSTRELIASEGRSAQPEGSSTVSASNTDNSFNHPSTRELIASGGRSAQPEGSSTVSASNTDNSFNHPSTRELIASGGRSAQPEGSSTVSASNTDNSFSHPSTRELIASGGRSAQPEGSSTVSASNTDNSFNHPSTREVIAFEGRSPQPEGSSTVSASNTKNSFIDSCIKHLTESNSQFGDPVDILRYLQKTIVTGRDLEITDIETPITGETNFIMVDRADILNTGFEEIRSLTDMRNTLEVQFYGEMAADFGGPRKEFFRVILTAIKDKYFEPLRTLVPEDYETIGQIFALSMLQNGKIPQFLSPDLLQQIFESDNPIPVVEYLRKGLDSLGLYQIGRRFPIFLHLMRPSAIILTFKRLTILLKPVFSEEGSNARRCQTMVYKEFVTYAREVASGLRGALSLGDILMFVTGADDEPVLGFPIHPEISFPESLGNSFLPTANTCINRMLLPRPSMESPLPKRELLFNLYDYAFSNSYYGMK